jgi:hypothetical protein
MFPVTSSKFRDNIYIFSSFFQSPPDSQGDQGITVAEHGLNTTLDRM